MESQSKTVVLVTGAKGFVGRNLCTHLSRFEALEVVAYDLGDDASILERGIAAASIVFHLAGVNRPQNVDEFQTGNADFTQTLCQRLAAENVPLRSKNLRFLFSSTIQAALDNPYGASKRAAESVLETWAAQTGCTVSVFRFTNLFGKWCRPNYNSVTATFCFNIAHGLPIDIRDPNYAVRLAYIDDVIGAMLTEAELLNADSPASQTHPMGKSESNAAIHPTEKVESTLRYAYEHASFRRVADHVVPDHTITLGELAEKIRFFHAMPTTFHVPDAASRFERQLYVTYLSYLEPSQWEYGPIIRADHRGNLAELLKSPHFGQVFVSRTHPGVTRGNHYHHTKTEKFIVIAGTGRITFRRIDDPENKIIEFMVRGEDYRIVDIPPGYTHAITNVGDNELITLFWASEIFDPEHPDTFWLPVEPAEPIV
ncbi:MAG: NAD-dependent epimerase/dehydratase family protein [Thermoguttaceae bacterium]|nr:NAD-dependent epimerase/dehydratase family protein [Thermoguttaceae bacterium]